MELRSAVRSAPDDERSTAEDSLRRACELGTTYDNFARDFGERCVPGYTRPSAVDFLLGAPFKE